MTPYLALLSVLSNVKQWALKSIIAPISPNVVQFGDFRQHFSSRGIAPCFRANDMTKTESTPRVTNRRKGSNIRTELCQTTKIINRLVSIAVTQRTNLCQCGQTTCKIADMRSRSCTHCAVRHECNSLHHRTTKRRT